MSLDFDNRPVPVPGRIGQGTAIEMSRAAAEVMASVQVAQACPRNVLAAKAAMLEACTQLGLAQRAFYSYNRGGGVISGATIHLARELVRVWGNAQYGLKELRRDDDYHQSEMEAWAWDVQTNTRNSSVFVVPHKRTANGETKVLTDMRDIYETNTNNGARRVRTAIFAILPKWFTDLAEETCRTTLKAGVPGVRLEERIEQAIVEYRKGGVTVQQLEQRVGKPAPAWDGNDCAELEILFGSLKRREITKEEAFPAERVTLEEITGQAQPAAQPEPATAAAPAEPAPDPDGKPASARLLKRMHDTLTARGVTHADDRLDAIGRILGRQVDYVTSPLSHGEATYVASEAEAAPEGTDLVTGQVVPAGAGVDPATYTEAGA